MTTRTVMLTVDVESDEQLVRAVETLSRALTGLMLEGLETRLSAYESTDLDDEPH